MRSFPRARRAAVVAAFCLAAVALWPVVTAETQAADGPAWERKLTPGVRAALAASRPVRVLVTFRDRSARDRAAALRRLPRAGGALA